MGCGVDDTFRAVGDLGRTLEASWASIIDAEYQVFVADQNGDPLGFLILDSRGVAGAPYIHVSDSMAADHSASRVRATPYEPEAIQFSTDRFAG